MYKTVYGRDEYASRLCSKMFVTNFFVIISIMSAASADDTSVAAAMAHRRDQTISLDGTQSSSGGVAGVSTAEISDEYCPFEFFNATCQQNEVLLIRAARYGRMRLGRCVKVDLGYLGCATDVKHQVDARCTGRRHCVMSVGDESLRMTKPCPLDVTWYLEVVYVCVRVLTREGATCRSDGLSTPLLPNGYIGSIVSLESHYGHDKCPWMLTVQPGQQIRFTLVGYYTSSVPHSSSSSSSSLATQQQGMVAKFPPRLPDVCIDLGAVVEGTEEKRTPLNVCGEDLNQRDRPLYTSETSRARLSLSPTGRDDVFLMLYEAVGCPMFRVPVGGWSKRVDDKLIIRCNSSDEVWPVVCRGNVWDGFVGNCTPSHSARSKEWQQNLTTSGSALPISILVAVAVGVALGIFIGGVLLAVVGSRINRSRKPRFQEGGVVTGDYQYGVSGRECGGGETAYTAERATRHQTISTEDGGNKSGRQYIDSLNLCHMATLSRNGDTTTTAKQGDGQMTLLGDDSSVRAGGGGGGLILSGCECDCMQQACGRCDLQANLPTSDHCDRVLLTCYRQGSGPAPPPPPGPQLTFIPSRTTRTYETPLLT